MGGVNVANVTNFLSVTYQKKGLEIEGYALARCMNQEIYTVCLSHVWIFIRFLSILFRFMHQLLQCVL